MQLVSEISVQSQRGYSTESMNTDYIICNMSLSKSFKKTPFTLKIEGFDIFNQISTTNIFVGNTSKSETITNSIPSYFMAHLIYQIHKAPKKRK